MEARASFSGSSVSRTFVAAVLVVVAMGLAAMSGYLAGGVFARGTTATQNQAVHAAPGTVLRQDSPASANAEVLGPAPGTVLRQDNPSQSAAGPARGRSTGHQELP